MSAHVPADASASDILSRLPEGHAIAFRDEIPAGEEHPQELLGHYVEFYLYRVGGSWYTWHPHMAEEPPGPAPHTDEQAVTLWLGSELESRTVPLEHTLLPAEHLREPLPEPDPTPTQRNRTHPLKEEWERGAQL